MRYFVALGIFVLLLTLVIPLGIVSGENEADVNAKAIQQRRDPCYRYRADA